MQIVLGVAMAAGKLRTAKLENGLHLRGRDALRQQMPGDPEVHNAPVGRRKSLRNPPSLQAALVDRSGLIEGDRRCGMGVYRWNARLTGMRTIGREPNGHGGLDQGTCLRRHASPGMHDLHPGTIAAAATPAQLLVGKAGESAQMTPIRTGAVATIQVCQMPAHCSSEGRGQRGGTDVHPSLPMAGAGLEHHTMFMTVRAHRRQHSRIGVVQIDQEVASVPVLSIWVEVHVASLAIA